MTDPFLEKQDVAADPGGDDERIDTMSRVQEPTTGGDSAPATDQLRQMLGSKRVCPYCGHQTAHGSDPCPRCTMEDTPSTRQATKTRIGPWYVLQSRNPAAPGMKYATLLALINKGHVSPRSIVRGPTTHQMWRYAAHVRGISREFGLCFSCGGSVDRGSAICPHCQRSQDAPADPDVLIESRAVAQPQAPQAAQEQFIEPPTSYAQRMRDLNRQRAKGDLDQRSESNLPIAAPRGKSEVPARRGGTGRVVSAMELAAALQDDPNTSDVATPRSRKIKVLAALVLLIAAGTAGVFYFMPEYRQPTLTWLSDTKGAIIDKWHSIQWQPNGSTERKATESVAAKEPAPEPVITPPAPTVSPVAQSPAPSPAPAPVAPTVSEPAVEVSIKAPPAPAVAPAGTVIEATQPPEPKPQPVDASAALDQVRTLWRQAIDAEAKQDFAGAARFYQAIKNLPTDVWPSGLQLRLDYAQKQVSQSSSAAQ